MPQITIPRALIQLDLSDRIFNDTTIKQEAIFESLRHEQHPETGVATTTVLVTVKSYANDNGSKGTYLGDKGMMDKRVPLVADNDTVVNPTTGTIIAIKDRLMMPFEWEAQVAAIEEDWCYQGDWFIQLRDSGTVTIGTLIRQHIQQADQMGKFS